MKKQAPTNISVSQYIENVIDLINEGDNKTHITTFSYPVTGGPFSNNARLDKAIIVYAETIGFEFVGQGCGFGVRDLEFECGNLPPQQIWEHCAIMTSTFNMGIPITGYIDPA